jgi:hypothetical protein
MLQRRSAHYSFRLSCYLFSKARILGFHLPERFSHGRELFLGPTL